jgi:hypothetical protein
MVVVVVVVVVMVVVVVVLLLSNLMDVGVYLRNIRFTRA